LTTAVTESPFFNPSSSALRRVITDSMMLSPTRTVMCARTVVVDGVFQRRNAAVVHVRLRDGDIAKRRRLELPNVGWLVRDLEQACVRRG